MNVKGIIIRILEVMGKRKSGWIFMYYKDFEKLRETEQKWILNQN
jgi:ribosomal protein S24E